MERFVHELCHDSINPPIAPVIERLSLPNSTGEDVAVIKVDVARSLFVHRSPGGYLHRVGSAKRVMSPEYLARLFQQRSQTRLVRFDEQVWTILHVNFGRGFEPRPPAMNAET